eukprot:15793087-Heterocapsa_arctica.AAC.1
MDGNQVRSSIVEQPSKHWKDTMEFDLDGEQYINFLSGTSDKKQWGGAKQVAICSRIEAVKVDIHSFGNMVQNLCF